MHPILADRRRLLPYLAPWAFLGLLVAAVLHRETGLAWLPALSLAMPLLLIYAFVCLAAWYPSRSSSLDGPNLWRALLEHLLAALLSLGLWLAVGKVWAELLDRGFIGAGLPEIFESQISLLALIGLLLYVLGAAGSYLYLALEASRKAERQALEARRRQELADQELTLARSLQRRLLPLGEQHHPEFRLAARNLAARGVAGDFYDYFFLPDGSLRLAVADVAGKGLSASLITATVKAMLPLIAAGLSPVETLKELNRRLAADLAPREFVALALAGFDPATGELELVNAGLPDPYLITPDGRNRPLEAPQPRLPLGLRPEVRYESVRTLLTPGERLLMLTDGLPEAPVSRGEPLGYDALRTYFDHRSEDPIRWLETLLDRLRSATLEELDDDWTALILERSTEARLPTGRAEVEP